MKNKYLLAIFGIGLFLRVVALGSIPAGFTPDEASYGYDAYSIIHTGKDQWGSILPYVFKSFGDGKLPAYTYLSIPFVYIFGLTEVSTRMASALIGSLAIIATYLLVQEVFKNKKLALFSSLLLAVNPWHIQMSRGAFEANLTTFFLPIGLYFFFRGLRNNKFLILSSILLGLNMFTYHSARLVTPMLVMVLIYFYRDKINFYSHQSKISGVIFTFFVFFAAVSLLGGGGSRVATSTIFSESANVYDLRYSAVKNGEPSVIAKVFNNKASYVAERFAQNYIQYFSPQFYFTNGAGEGSYGMVPGMGVLLYIELLFGVFLFIGLAGGKIKIPKWIILFILLSPIPAAISVGPGYAANRSVIMLPILTVILASGGLYLFRHINKYLFWTAFAVSILVFSEKYYFQQPVREAKAMIYGSRQVVEYVNGLEPQYSQIIFTKKMSEPHIFIAFYNTVDPAFYQLNSRAWDFSDKGYAWVDQQPQYSLGKYLFKNIDWVADSQIAGVLLVGVPGDFPADVVPLKTVYYPNGKVAYVVVDPSTTGFALLN